MFGVIKIEIPEFSGNFESMNSRKKGLLLKHIIKLNRENIVSAYSEGANAEDVLRVLNDHKINPHINVLRRHIKNELEN